MRLNTTERQLFADGFVALLTSMLVLALSWFFWDHAGPGSIIGFVCHWMAAIAEFVSVCSALIGVFLMGMVALSKILSEISAPNPTRRPPPQTPQ